MKPLYVLVTMLFVVLLIIVGLLNLDKKYAIAVVDSTVKNDFQNLKYIIKVKFFCEKTLLILRNIESIKKEYAGVITENPSEKILVAVYSCKIDTGFTGSIRRCFEMLRVLEQCPLRQCFWVISSNATAES